MQIYNLFYNFATKFLVICKKINLIKKFTNHLLSNLQKSRKKYFSLLKIFLKFVVHNLCFYKLFYHYKTTTN